MHRNKTIGHLKRWGGGDLPKSMRRVGQRKKKPDQKGGKKKEKSQRPLR